ncbi:hypothetical protein [Roseicyclus marinus]|jgi:hypothetical protein|uniref:hypothetical protein n=1 Tax=Roseicyclus marinus TaxID=2161673 RepID=UPI00240F1581|nr:hypothetical protein [Roseicyclus marinus]MDG3039847.1 hypothetical protein [Roseicyclus marinus]
MPPKGHRRDPEFADIVDIRDPEGKPLTIEPWLLVKAAVLLAERTREDGRSSHESKVWRVNGIWALLESLGKHDKRFEELVTLGRGIETKRDMQRRAGSSDQSAS